MTQKARDAVLIEKRAITSPGEPGRDRLTPETEAICAVLDRIIAKLPTVGERRILEKLGKEIENRPGNSAPR